MVKKEKGRGNVELYIGGKLYNGVVSGIRQDTEVYHSCRWPESYFTGGMIYVTITFGVGELEVPINRSQYKRIMEELQTI